MPGGFGRSYDTTPSRTRRFLVGWPVSRPGCTYTLLRYCCYYRYRLFASSRALAPSFWTRLLVAHTPPRVREANARTLFSLHYNFFFSETGSSCQSCGQFCPANRSCLLFQGAGGTQDAALENEILGDECKSISVSKDRRRDFPRHARCLHLLLKNRGGFLRLRDYYCEVISVTMYVPMAQPLRCSLLL